MSEEKKVTVTIVTVCYNAETVIEKTLQSVLRQTFTDYEYIVKDGGSTDRTNEIVSRYAPLFAEKRILFRHVIEKDRGIYDAMNQATTLAQGRWINYMNADDIFLDERVLERIFEGREYEEDVLYGDSVCEYIFYGENREYALWKGQHQSFVSMPFSHQACFLSARLMKEYLYDTKYRSAADFHVLLRFYKDKHTFRNIGHIVSICTMDGVSNTSIKTSYRETLSIKQELGAEEFLEKNSAFSLWLMGVKQWILQYLPRAVAGRLLRFQVARGSMRLYSSLKELREQNKI